MVEIKISQIEELLRHGSCRLLTLKQVIRVNSWTNQGNKNLANRKAFTIWLMQAVHKQVSVVQGQVVKLSCCREIIPSFEGMQWHSRAWCCIKDMTCTWLKWSVYLQKCSVYWPTEDGFCSLYTFLSFCLRTLNKLLYSQTSVSGHLL